MHNQAILNCLPVLADVLGRTYGGTVEIGGDAAFTDGQTIRLPRLPAQADPAFINLVRGYIDHEAAHVRHTNFKAVERENLSPLEHHIWNILEDWRVEQKLATRFPGCRQNFRWLIRHLFGHPRQSIRLAGDSVLSWLILTVRSWEVPDLVPYCLEEQQQIDRHWPRLRPQLEAILTQVQAYCPNSIACVIYARKIVECLTNITTDSTTPPASAIELNNLLQAQADQLPQDMGHILQTAMGEQNVDAINRHGVAVIGHKALKPLTTAEQDAIQRITAGLQAKLLGKLQASRMVRQRPSHKGKLDPKRLYGIRFGQRRVFLTHEPKPAINTAVHILLDSSASMQPRIELACMACNAVAQALIRVGIPTGITAFPGKPDRSKTPSIVPILCQGDVRQAGFSIEASGNTPLAEALWWVLQRLVPEPQGRKIILILTDGAPDDLTRAQRAVTAGLSIGMEIYALGIDTPQIVNLLPNSANITNLSELPSAVFALLEQALVSNRRIVA